jgi:hypothetical protein
MDRTRFVTHKSKQIVLMDFSGVTDIQEGLGHIEDARRFIAEQPKKKNLLTLVDIAGSTFDKRTTGALRGLSAHNKPWVIANATVGVSGLKGMLVTTIARMTGRKLKVFQEQGAAMNWLVAQSTD